MAAERSRTNVLGFGIDRQNLVRKSNHLVVIPLPLVDLRKPSILRGGVIGRANPSTVRELAAGTSVITIGRATDGSLSSV
jgi:hypothetical protein